jgi:hypothetical protein
MTEEVRISWGDKVAKRYESNQRIVEILSELVEKFPPMEVPTNLTECRYCVQEWRGFVLRREL